MPTIAAAIKPVPVVEVAPINFKLTVELNVQPMESVTKTDTLYSPERPEEIFSSPLEVSKVNESFSEIGGTMLMMVNWKGGFPPIA